MHINTLSYKYIIALTLVVVSLVFFLVLTKPIKQVPVQEIPPLRVEIAVLQKHDLYPELELTGYLQPARKVKLHFELSGQITDRLVEAGRRVEPEELLLQMEAGDYLDIVKEAAAAGTGHDVDIISGATVTVMIIDDSIVRSSIKVARALGLGGLKANIVSKGPTYAVDMSRNDLYDWQTLAGDGSVRRLTLEVGQINAAFDATDDPRVEKYAEPGEPDDIYIDMYVAPVSVPSIGFSLLGDAEYGNLVNWLEEGEHAILLAGRGLFSYKGSGYVRGGVFDRIHLIQGDISVRFRDKQQRRMGEDRKSVV